MRFGAIIALLAGLALVCFLVLHVGIRPVFGAVARVGWSGFAIIVLSWFAVTVLLGTAFYTLLSDRAHWWVFVAARQLRDSAGDVLPFTQFGGIVIGARAVILGRVSPPVAFAGAMVDVTADLVAQIAFMALGLMLGIAQLRANAVMVPYVDGLFLGTALLIPGVIAFVVLQRGGSLMAKKLLGHFLPATVSHTEAFAKALNGLYKKHLRLAFSTILHLLGWIVSGVWLWVVFRLLGAHIDVFSAIAIQSLLEALRSATAFVPSSIGIQEAGYAALAPIFGVGPEVGLAVSLLRRARDIVIGIPVLLAWQIVESRRAVIFEKDRQAGRR
jgi:putative membrane protein